MAIVFVLLLAGGLALAVIGWMGLLEKLPPNHFAGIRTPFTMKSADNWYRTHRAAAPLLIFGGVAVTAVALACLPFALLGKLPDGFALTVAVMGAVLVLGTAVGAWLAGTAAAKRAS